MHADQVEPHVEVVAQLVASQFPSQHDPSITRVASHGTVNALFRVGGELVARFPLQLADATRDEVAAEIDNARRIGPHVPVAVPQPIGLGAPGPGYPGHWSMWSWIAGGDANSAPLGHDFAGQLAGFVHAVHAVHAVDTGGRGWSGRGRGGPLADHDEQVRHWLHDARGLIDIAPVAAKWARCVQVATHAGPDVCLHADLMPGNLIVRDGWLAAVLDLGSARFGDPAVDLMPAWNLFTGSAREEFRRAMGVDDATWERGRGWAILQAIGALAYYVRTNPLMSETARRTLAAALQGRLPVA